ncbi:hypothetical protein NDU88_008457 [Pleurodeles waltl]|uniref:Uncharacterized protein n=1 Tax=Pleurodeles waltl TaxID=8319 RepID=A0AAV7PP73_PLEWA|nr:hypothetical protein NDU88_008457 [Pleurodeles waltl]
MEADLTVEEIKGAVGDMSRDKTPGSDGLPIEFYNIYIDKLAPQLLKLYIRSLQWEANLQTASNNMIRQLIDIAQEYEKYRNEVDTLNKQIDEAK